MKDEVVIRVEPTGALGCLYGDDLDLADLGRLVVTRASHVEFDNVRQGWTVELANGAHLPGVYPRRADALRAEVEYLNTRITYGTIEEALWPSVTS